MDSLCLTGQGRGRIEHSSGRHVFTYESLWEPEKSQWSLALGLPLIGQELIRFHYDQNGKKPKVSGNFAKRLRKERINHSTNGLLERFYEKLSQWLVINRQRKIPSRFSGWNLSLNEGNLIATAKIDSQHLFELRAFAWDDYYERMTLSLVRRLPVNRRQSV
jgi:hypothetical protein